MRIFCFWVILLANLVSASYGYLLPGLSIGSSPLSSRSNIEARQAKAALTFLSLVLIRALNDDVNLETKRREENGASIRRTSAYPAEAVFRVQTPSAAFCVKAVSATVWQLLALNSYVPPCASG